MADNGYVTVSALKARLSITDQDDDTRLGAIIAGVSRWIDRYTGRRFYTTDSDETRYYTPYSYCNCSVDDLVSVTSIAIDTSGARTYDTTLGDTDYDLLPDNAALEGWPWNEIRITPYGRYSFYPSYTRSVKVVGKFGFLSTSIVLAQVAEACFIQCARIWKRGDAPFGLAGAGPMGQVAAISDLDPDVKAMLAPPIKRTRFK